MNILKKIVAVIAVLTLVLVGCSSGKYTDKIDKAVKLQEKKQSKIAKRDAGDEVKHFDKRTLTSMCTIKGNMSFWLINL